MDNLHENQRIVARYKVISKRPASSAELELWNGIDEILGREVLIWYLRSADANASLDVARKTALISDPHLVRILDVVISDNRHFVITESPSETTLASLVATRPLSDQTARAFISNATRGIRSAHLRGIVHGNLSAERLHLQDGIVKVSGLGIKLHSPDATKSSKNKRSDIQQLVALLYFALSGQEANLGEAYVPLSELVPDVAKDLDTLCTVTLGPQDDGPFAAIELINELGTWEEGILAKLSPLVAKEVAGTEETEAATGLNDADEVKRTSIKDSLDSEHVAPSPAGTPIVPPPPVKPVGSASEGIPPVVIPPTFQPAGAASTGTGVNAGNKVPLNTSAQSVPRKPTRTAIARKELEDSARKKYISTTPVVMTIMVIAVVLVGLWGFNTLKSGFKPIFGDDDTSARPTASVKEPIVEPTEPQDSEPTPEPTESETSTVAPIIVGAQQLDPPPGDGNEHPEAVDRAIDSDLTTFWYTRTYSTPNFGGLKDGVGYGVTFQVPSGVKEVKLLTNNTGGNVEVRSTQLTDPSGGDLLASGPLSAETVFTLEESVTTQNIVLWFTELPQNSEGRNLVQLYEIQIS